MPDLKQQLTELIDAFATARSTGNQLLAQQSAQALVQFLEGVNITQAKPEVNDGDED